VCLTDVVASLIVIPVPSVVRILLSILLHNPRLKRYLLTVGKRCNRKRSRRGTNPHGIYTCTVCFNGISVNLPAYCNTGIPAAAGTTV